MNEINKKIEINIGTVCNNDCLFCMSSGEGRKRSLIDFNVICQDLEKYRQEAYDSIGFLGGEITIYPQVLELISYAKNLGYKSIHIISNARKFNDFSFLKKLVNSGVTRISVSVHSHVKDIENYLNNRDAYDEQIAGIKNLLKLYNSKQLKERIALNMVINKLNFQTLDKTIKFFNNLGIRDFRLNFIWPEGSALLNKEKLLLRYKDLKPYIKKWFLIAKFLKLYLSLESVPFCIIRNKTIINNLYGEYKDGKVDVVVGKERDFFNWQKRKKEQFKIKPYFCQKCTYNNKCDGIWKNYLKIFGDQEFSPINSITSYDSKILIAE